MAVGLAHPGLWAGGAGSAGPRPTHAVAPGETLWSIAERYGGGRDPRRYLYDLEQLNPVGSGTIYPGETITLP
jgi:LysM repeat protein